jgi:hypothetical protein
MLNELKFLIIYAPLDLKPNILLFQVGLMGAQNDTISSL